MEAHIVRNNTDMRKIHSSDAFQERVIKLGERMGRQRQSSLNQRGTAQAQAGASDEELFTGGLNEFLTA